ncbi:MAG: hypothetical protein KAQ98_06200 [Bacteriovoracaceae bacterium]|nr:hypothetical protein [Bacteriovoracaceae bacterium]
MKKITFLIFLVFHGITVSNAYLVDDDKDYFIRQTGDFKLIYPAEYRKLSLYAGKIENAIIKEYRKSFDWKLDDKPDIVMASSNNQIANAFATVFHNNLNVYYGGGAPLSDYFAERSWLFSLISHEGAHLYQLDVKEEVSRVYYSIFGSSFAPHSLIFVPIFTNPNFLLPLWILEGNAVFNESRFGNGGRLFSGEARALFYALLKDNLLDETRLTNNHLEFPFGQEKYIVGSYFTLYLANKYGIEKVNRYFREQAEHYLWPLIVDWTFIDHYGLGYPESIEGFIDNYKPRALKQKSLKIKSNIAQTVRYVPMNRQDGKILFLTTDGKSTPVLVTVDETSRKIHKKRVDLPMGKVFIVNGKPYSAASGLVGKKRIYYSLWNDDDKDIPKWRSKIVLDMRGGHDLWFDAKRSFDEPVLFKNKKRVGVSNSLSLLDESGNVYRFIQKGKKRTLYRNSKPLFSYDSYYGKIVDIDSYGKIYFVANTEYGSTLYSWIDGKFSREVLSDTIVDAKKLKDGRLLVLEVTSEGYFYSLTKPQLIAEKPSGYNYFFEKNDEINLYDRMLKDRVVVKQSAPVKERKYSMIRDMRFTGASSSVLWGWPSGDVDFTVSGAFSDPLMNNSISFMGKKGNIFGIDNYSIQYEFSKYLLDVFAFYNLEKKYPTDENPKRITKYEDLAAAGIRYPLIKKRNSLLDFKFYFGHKNREDEFGGYASLKFVNRNDYFLGFSPYKLLTFLGEYERDDEDDYTASFWTKWSKDIHRELYLSLDGIIKSTNEFELPLSLPISREGEPIISGNQSIYGNGLRGSKIGGRIGFELKKAVNHGLYFSTFPFSLMRFAPKILAHYYFYDFQTRENFQEFGGGFDFDILAIHLAPVRLSVCVLSRDFVDTQVMAGIFTMAKF